MTPEEMKKKMRYQRRFTELISERTRAGEHPKNARVPARAQAMKEYQAESPGPEMPADWLPPMEGS